MSKKKYKMEEIKNPKYQLKVCINEKRFEDDIIIKDLNLNIEKGESISLIGASGVGKTTFFKIISGLDTNYSGEVLFENNKLSRPSKDISLMLQGHRLLPWLTVKRNIKFINNSINDNEIKEYLRTVGIINKEHAWPNTLSGGEKTRIGLSIALINRTKVLLLDEPFADVDIKVKVEIFEILNKIKYKHNTTTMLVTHNIDDAVKMTNRVIVLSGKPANIVYDAKITENHRNEIAKEIADIINNKKVFI